MKIRYLSLIVVFITTSLLFSAETGIIKGTVFDKDTREPLPGVNMLLKGTQYGTVTDANGKYKLVVPAGSYELKVMFVGYEQLGVKVNIKAGKEYEKDLYLEQVESKEEEIIVTAQRQVLKLDKSSSRLVGMGAPPSPMAESYEDFIPHNTEEYSKINESGFINALAHPLSTFAADVDAAAYSNARRFLMQDQLPYKDVVRSEEFINYFNYDYKEPDRDVPLSVNMEYSDCPWNEKNKLVHIGLQGKRMQSDEKPASNLVFLLDVSGSMNSPKKLPLLKKSFTLLTQQLDKNDRVAIVVYAGNAGLVLPSTHGDKETIILKALDKLQAGGSTAGGEGIQLAYKVAKENYIKGGNNRVIIGTDGDFNVGISSTSELTRFIEEKRDEGIFLTVLGFGMGNYKDYRLQELADRGNGNHAYIDNIMEAKKVLVNDLTGTLFTIAKDVKIQVEFNPSQVESYRLIGYENRELADKDFTDDTKDAGEIGAGHTVTALYEIVPAGSNQDPQDLKYTQTTIKDEAKHSKEILTVRIRYKEPDGNKSKEFSAVLDQYTPFEKTTNNFRFSASVAQFAMLIRESEFKGECCIESTKKLALSSMGDDPFGYRMEFLSLLDRYTLLQK